VAKAISINEVAGQYAERIRGGESPEKMIGTALLEWDRSHALPLYLQGLPADTETPDLFEEVSRG
jgi:hypothetical protein